MGRTAAVAERAAETAENDGVAGDPWKTILFNCDCHTFDEVERIVIAATRCSLSRARQISFEVHTRGSAVVCEGPRARCEAVAEPLAGVGLRVKVAR